MDNFEKEFMRDLHNRNNQHADAILSRTSSLGDYLLSKFARDDQYDFERRRIEDAREDQAYYRSMNRNNYNKSRYSKKYKKSKKKKNYYKKRR